MFIKLLQMAWLLLHQEELKHLEKFRYQEVL
jgi:hypothetical protein